MMLSPKALYGSDLQVTGNGSVCVSVSGSVSGSVFAVPSPELKLVSRGLWIRLWIEISIAFKHVN
jgi:hypothetical protein